MLQTFILYTITLSIILQDKLLNRFHIHHKNPAHYMLCQDISNKRQQSSIAYLNYKCAPQLFDITPCKCQYPLLFISSFYIYIIFMFSNVNLVCQCCGLGVIA